MKIFSSVKDGVTSVPITAKVDYKLLSSGCTHWHTRQTIDFHCRHDPILAVFVGERWLCRAVDVFKNWQQQERLLSLPRAWNRDLQQNLICCAAFRLLVIIFGHFIWVFILNVWGLTVIHRLSARRQCSISNVICCTVKLNRQLIVAMQ